MGTVNDDDGLLFAEDPGRTTRVELLDALLAADLTANEAADILYGVVHKDQGKAVPWRSPAQYAEMIQALERMLFRAGFTLR